MASYERRTRFQILVMTVERVVVGIMTRTPDLFLRAAVSKNNTGCDT